MSGIMDWPALLPLALLLAGVGFVTGFLAGLFGIGGGAIMVIALYEALGFVDVDPAHRMHLATGTALAILGPTTYRSFVAHHARGAVDMDLVRRLAPAILIGVGFGVLIAARTGGSFLKWVWVVMGTFLAVRMALGRDDWRLGPDIPSSKLVEAYGTFVGAISALMSIGGGAYITLLMTLYSRPLHQAVGTSSAFGPLIGFPAALGFICAGWGASGLPPGSLGYVSLVGAALMIPSGMLAAPVGARIAHGWPKRTLELAFAAFMGSVVLRYLYGLLT